MKKTLLFITILLSLPAITKELIYENVSQRFIESLNRNLLDDPQKKVSTDFTISNYLMPSVKFWFKIYTKHSKDFILIHDKKNLNIIYDAINFKELSDSKLNRYVKANLQKEIIREKVNIIRKKLKKLIKSKNSPLKNGSIDLALRRASIPLPKNRKSRKTLYYSLLKNLRTQTGQKDMVIKAINTYLPYQNTIEYLITIFLLPKEIISIPFVESSFNLKAESKANAVGVWQFIKRTGKQFLPIKKHYDLRKNPLVSTIAAMHLLRQNYKIFKDWPLAITAYNSGPKHILKAYSKIKNKKDKLSEYFKSYSHPSIAFASKNYYAEFLAMTYALNYKNMLFHYNISPPQNKMIIYVSRCKLVPKQLFKNLAEKSSILRKLNRQFSRVGMTYPRGSILVSNIELDSSKFYQVTTKNMLSHYPKNYFKLIRNYSCSRI